MQKNLQQSLERFVALQAAHHDALCGGRLAECMEWRGQREMAFREVQSRLAQLGDAEGLTKEELAAVCEVFRRLLDGEHHLIAAVQEQQQRIGKQLCAMRRGKQLLGRLGAMQNGTRGIPPRVLSNRA